MKKRQRKAYTVEEREVQIVGAIQVNMQSGGNGWLTTTDIAHALHMTPSTHLRLILADMVTRQVIWSRNESDPGIAGFRRLYTVYGESGLATIKKLRAQASMDEKRHIRVNSRQMSFDMEVR